MNRKIPEIPTSPRAEAMFPVLTTAQTARIATHGRIRPVNGGEVLLEAGGLHDRGIGSPG